MVHFIISFGWVYFSQLRENNIKETKPTSLPSFPIDAPTEQAAEKVVEAFKRIADENGPESIGFLGSPYATNEESYLYQKLFRLLGTNNIDHKSYLDVKLMCRLKARAGKSDFIS